MIFIINFILRAAWKFRTVILHGIIVLLLIGVTVWDSNLIINTFIYDNQNTIVKTQPGNSSTTPFLEKVRFQHSYPEGASPMSWLRELSGSRVQDTDHYKNLRDHQIVNGTFVLSSINVSTLQGRALGTDLFHLLAYGDREYGSDCLLYGRKVCEESLASKSMHVPAPHLDYILRNATELERLENEMIDYYMKTNLYEPMRGVDVTIHCIACSDAFTDFDVTVHTATRNGYDSHVTLKLSDYPSTRMLENKNDSYVADVEIYAGRSRLEARFVEHKQAMLYLDVRNLGIYDKSKTAECTDDPDLLIRMHNHPDCDDRGYLKALVRKCRCVPFSEKKRWREFEEAASVVDLPFCSFQHYYNCSEQLGPIKIDECLPSCKVIRNQYTLSILDDYHDDDSINKYVDIYFTLYDLSYVIYEDRYQSTIPQFVGQLGGDIGLYTGLSVLGIWQFVVFMHNRYKIYNDRYFRKHPDSKRRKNLKYFRGFIGELLKSIETFITKLPQDQQDGAMKSKEKNTLVPTGSQSKRRSSLPLVSIPGSKIETGNMSSGHNIRDFKQRMESEMSELKKETESKFVEISLKLEDIISLVSNSTDKEKHAQSTTFRSARPSTTLSRRLHHLHE